MVWRLKLEVQNISKSDANCFFVFLYGQVETKQNRISVPLRVPLPELVTLPRLQAGLTSRVFSAGLYLIWDSLLVLCKSVSNNGLWYNLLFNVIYIVFAVLVCFVEEKKKREKENRETVVRLKISLSYSLLSLLSIKVCGYFVMSSHSIHTHCWCLALPAACSLLPSCMTSVWFVCPKWIFEGITVKGVRSHGDVSHLPLFLEGGYQRLSSPRDAW